MIHEPLKEYAKSEMEEIKRQVKTATGVCITDKDAYQMIYSVIQDLDIMRAKERKDGKRNKEVTSYFLNNLLDSIFDNIEELRR